MYYLNLVGGMITCQFPYVFIVLFGWYFSKLHAFERDMIKPLTKTIIFVFLPCYYFIWIGKCNSVTNINNYYLLIISEGIKTVLSFLIAFTYASISNMDIRYKYSWIALITFQDVRFMNQGLVNTFCYNLGSKIQNEVNLCSSYSTYSFIHLFFHLVILWYVTFNLIRIDKLHTIAVCKVGENMDLKDQVELASEETNENQELALKFKNRRRKEDNDLHVTSSFSIEVGKYYDKYIKYEKQTLFAKVIYTTLQPVLIAIFCGFILGFITIIKSWWFNPDSTVTLFVDTLTTIGNANIVCGFLIMGAKLYYNEKEAFEARFKRSEYLVLLLFKCILLPFCGLIFIWIASGFIDNRPLLFASYIQWFMPSSQDILVICHSKDVSAYSVTVIILVQYIYMFTLNNFIMMGPLMKILNLL